MDRPPSSTPSSGSPAADQGSAPPEREPAGPEAPESAAVADGGAAVDEAAVVDGDEAGGDAGGAGLSWGRVAILGLALAFLGFAVGVVVGRDRQPGADSVDVGFLQDMLTHHDQSLGVAALTIANGENPTVRSYAADVLTFQSYEIGMMTQMLRDRGFSRGERSDEAMAWMGMPVPVDQMPGLLTDEQLGQVDDARGAELDALFLDLMAEHHRGGLHMAQDAAERAESDEVAELAARIARNQAGEINEYRATAQRLGLDVDIPGADVPPAELPPADE
jgi:uncharacterized protein (DUF305 family)